MTRFTYGGCACTMLLHVCIYINVFPLIVHIPTGVSVVRGHDGHGVMDWLR